MKLNNRQKVLVTLIVIGFAYALWQVYVLFIRDDQPVPPAPMTTQVPSLPATGGGNTDTVASADTPAIAAPPAPPTDTVKPAPKAAVPTSTGFTLEAPPNEYQMQYQDLVNQYQLLKMQRMVVEEEVAVASARGRLVALEQKTGGPGAASTLDVTGADAEANPTGYKLVYIDFQNGAWSATLSKGNRFLEVNTGDNLVDGTKVLRISQQGVVVEQQETQYVLTFYGTKTLGKIKPISADEVPSSKLYTPGAARKPTTSAPSATPTPAPATKPQAKTGSAKVVTPLTSEPVPDNKTTAKTATTPPMKPAAAPPPTIPASQQPASPKPALPAPPPQQSPLKPAPAPSANQPSSAVPPIPFSSEQSGTTPQQPAQPLQPPSSAVKKPLTTAQKNASTKLPVKKQNQRPNPAATAFAKNEKYLLAVPGSYYTLQLMGSRNSGDLTRLVRQYHLENQAHSFQTHYQNKNWYVLVYGVYKTSEDATDAIAALPAGLQNLKPWVRSVTSIHQALRSGRDRQTVQASRSEATTSTTLDPGIIM